ncbi:MAG: hypothetical protein QXJ64_08975 [Thermosphaera sp.]
MVHVDKTMDNVRKICREILDWHFEKAKGHIVTVRPGKYLLKKGIFDTSLAILVVDVILTEYKEYRYNGRIYRIIDINRKCPVRIHYADTTPVNPPE